MGAEIKAIETLSFQYVTFVRPDFAPTFSDQNRWGYQVHIKFRYEITKGSVPSPYFFEITNLRITQVDIPNRNQELETYFRTQPKITPQLNQPISTMADGTVQYYMLPSFLEKLDNPTAQEITFRFVATAILYRTEPGQPSQEVGQSEIETTGTLVVHYQAVPLALDNPTPIDLVFPSSLPEGAVLLLGNECKYKVIFPGLKHSDIIGGSDGFIAWTGLPSQNPNESLSYFDFVAFPKSHYQYNEPLIIEKFSGFYVSPDTYESLRNSVGNAPAYHPQSYSMTAKFVNRVWSKLEIPEQGSGQPTLQKIYLCAGSANTNVKFIPDAEMGLTNPLTGEIWTGNYNWYWDYVFPENTISSDKTELEVKFRTSSLRTSIVTRNYLPVTPFKDEQNNALSALSFDFGNYGWKEKSFKMRLPYMGWSSLAVYYYPITRWWGWDALSTYGMWYRIPLTGKWRVKFSGQQEEEIFTVEEKYNGKFETDIIFGYDENGNRIFKKYNLTGIGSKGTVFVGVATYIPVYVSDAWQEDGALAVQIRGTFANPAFGTKTTDLDGFESDHLVLITPQGQFKVKGAFTDATPDDPSDNPTYEAILELGTKERIKWFKDDAGNLNTVEVPRATSPKNKPNQAKASIISKPAEKDGTRCKTPCKETCFTDPITNQEICFDYQIGDPININNLEYVESATDLTIQSRGISFEFIRTYMKMPSFKK
jgi:hypothetical protein